MKGFSRKAASLSRGIHLGGINLSRIDIRPNEVTVNMLRRTRAHRHHEVTTHVIRQRAGVPYEVERTVCRECSKVLDERTLRRAAA